MKAIIIILSAMLTAGSAIAQPPFEVLGVKIDQVAEFETPDRKVPVLPTPWVCSSVVVRNMHLCDAAISPKEAGIGMIGTAFIDANGTVQILRLTTDVRNFETFRDAVLEKNGRASARSSSVTNAMGARFDQLEYSWRGPGGSKAGLSKRAREIDESMFWAESARPVAPVGKRLGADKL